MGRKRPPRVQKVSHVGRYRYVLTFCTTNRAPLFARAQLVQTARTRVEQTAREEQFAILAYCFMPDRVHLVVEGRTEQADLRRFATIAKQRVACSLRLGHGVMRVWQEGFHDSVLRPECPTEAAIRSVVEKGAGWSGPR